MDVTSTAQALAAASNVAQLPDQVLAIGGTAIASGAAMEHLLEQFVMDKCPPAIKPYVPAVVAIGGGTWAGMAAGLPWQAALAAGLTAYAAAVTKHDVPALSAAAPKV